MLPYNSGPSGWLTHRNGLYPPRPLPPPPPPHPPHPPPPSMHRYPNLDVVNSFQVHGRGRFPVYEWKPPLLPPPPPPRPPPPPTFPVLPPQTPPMNRRKRQHSDYSPQVVKHARLDATPHHPFMGPPFIRMPPPHHPDRAAAGSSRSGYDRSYSSPCSHPHPPESGTASQTSAKLSGQIVELFEACQQQSSDLARKEMCRSRLQEDISRVFAAGRLYLTGSSMNGLGCRSSDADLCLVIQANKRKNPVYVLSVLQKLFQSLVYVEKTHLIRAKVPILRFREKGSSLEFDLNVNNTVGIRNTFLLRAYAHADQRVKPLILVVKKWARHHQINDASKGTLSSYAVVLMVLHYLQTLKDPVVPSLQLAYPDCFSPLIDIDLVPEGPSRIPPYTSRNQSPLGELLLGFLEYYATRFRWDKYVISIREAKALPKTNTQHWRNKHICVEEPFERNNVARAVHEKAKFDAIRARFAESFHILKQRRDLNSILPVRDIINKESSMT